jgi:hypothetical protein
MPDSLIVTDPTGGGAAMDTSTTVDVPEATAEAVSL